MDVAVPRSRITRWLAAAPPWAFASYAVAMAFSTYFCMYAYRKPFAAGTWADERVLGLDLKGALVVSQLCGYALSKLAGIKFNSEMAPGRRALALVLLIGWAELALVVFALLPPGGKVFAIFLNGLPLGAVWGIVFSFLEGRRTSEILGAGLSCSYIVASGAVKSAGAAAITAGVPEPWMPALTGLVFLPPFLAAVYGLSLLPPPSPADEAARERREPMFASQRRWFVKRYLLGVVLLVIVYLLQTSFRDYRDNFAAEIWLALGTSGAPSVFTLSELPIALSVMVALGLLYLVRDNRLGLAATFGLMLAGSLLIGASTLLFDAGVIGGMPWMILVGLGLYLGYVPYGCVLFDRMHAALGIVGTAVFLIYLSDAFGYGGSVGVVLFKMLSRADMSKLDFFRGFSYATSVITAVCLLASGLYFLRRAPATETREPR